MSRTAAVQGEEWRLVTVRLMCIACGSVEEIQVFEERKLSGTMYWECLSCQAGGSRGPRWPEAGARH